MTLMILMGILMILTAMSLILYLLQSRKNEQLLKQQIILAENVADLKSKLEDRPVLDAGVDIEQQIAEAKDKIFTEWIQNIANYTPFNRGE